MKTKVVDHISSDSDESSDGSDSSVPFEDDHGKTPSYKLKANECFFLPDHPQHQSHVQRIRNVSNPKVVHVIPTMFALMLPNEKDDPDKYFLVLCAILTPYQNVKDLSVDFRDDAAPPFPNLQESFRAYMSTLSFSDPIKHQWIKRILTNMTAIRRQSAKGGISRLSNERRGNICNKNKSCSPMKT